MHHLPLAALGVAVIATGLAAQRGVTEASASKIPAWRKGVAWVGQIETAQRLATRSKRMVFAYYKGADRSCPRCRIVEDQVLATAAFSTFAATVEPVCIVSETKAPRFVFLNAAGEPLDTPREVSVPAFVKTLAVLTGLAAIKQPTAAQQAARFVAELELGRLSLAATRTRRKQLALDEAQLLIVKQETTNLVVKDLFARARKARDYSNLGPEFAAMRKNGVVPTGRIARVYWSQLMQHARAKKDATLFRVAYRRYRKLLGESAHLRSVYRRYDSILAELSLTK